MPPTFPSDLRSFLTHGCPALLLSVDDAGLPHTAFTWVVCDSQTCLRFAVDIGSGTERNLQRNPAAAVQIIGPDNLIFLIKGKARCVKARISAPGLQLARYELAVTNIKDQSWPHAVVSPLAFQWSESQRQSLQEMEAVVFAELRRSEDE